MEWPSWWEWELDISPHCVKRMEDRGFTETDLRTMLADAVNLVEQAHGTFLVETQLADVRWEVIVVPEDDEQVITIVTAYPCE